MTLIYLEKMCVMFKYFKKCILIKKKLFTMILMHNDKKSHLHYNYHKHQGDSITS